MYAHRCLTVKLEEAASLYQQLQELTAYFYSTPPTSSRISTAQLVVQVTI